MSHARDVNELEQMSYYLVPTDTTGIDSIEISNHINLNPGILWMFRHGL